MKRIQKIRGFNNYAFSKLGNIRNINTGKIAIEETHKKKVFVMLYSKKCKEFLWVERKRLQIEGRQKWENPKDVYKCFANRADIK